LAFELVPSKRILKELGKLESSQKTKLLDLFLKLKVDPVPAGEFNVLKLTGCTCTYQIRIQKIRVIYDVYWEEKRIEILKVEGRKGRTYKDF